MPSKPKLAPSATIRNLLATADGVDPRDAEHLLAFVLKTSRTALLAHPETAITNAKASRFKKLVDKRKAGEPLAYLLGTQPFFGHDFFVSPATLIPRPETEWLVQEGQKILENQSDIKTIIDVGTGSGCIILSLAASLTPQKRATLQWHAIDISKRALKVTQKNADQLGVTGVRFHCGDLLSPLLASNFLPRTSPVLLLANLPYGTTDDYTQVKPEVRHEPKNAIHAGKDGLKYYKQLLKQLDSVTSAMHCLFEIDPCHANELAELAKAHGGQKIKIEKDFNDFDRYLTLKLNIP